MSFHLDIDKRAEADRARSEAEAALARARLLLDRCRALLSTSVVRPDPSRQAR
jgi:hypothetical protein